MITKKNLENILSVRREIKHLDEKIKRLEKKETKIVKDSVSASTKEFPYTRYTAKTEGYEWNYELNKLKKMLKRAKKKLEKDLVNLEYEISKIQDSRIREIIRYKYEEEYSWVKIMHIMDFESEEAPRIKLERFFKKNNNVRFVRKRSGKIIS